MDALTYDQFAKCDGKHVIIGRDAFRVGPVPPRSPAARAVLSELTCLAESVYVAGL